MKPDALRHITKSLEIVLRELGDLADRGIRHRYAEFLVASRLAEHGHAVQLLDEREKTSADLYLPKIDARVEVKSCKAFDKRGEIGFSYASFGNGNQIKGRRFDFCVLVVFDSAAEVVQKVLIFTRDELTGLCRKRPGLAAHEDTNGCLLVCAPTLKEYEASLKAWGVRALDIERDICKHPKQFVNAWSKIRSL